MGEGNRIISTRCVLVVRCAGSGGEVFFLGAENTFVVSRGMGW